MVSRPLMISLLDKDDTELLDLVTHTFKEGLRNNVAMPGIPSLRSKMLNLIEVSLTCYNNHKEHEEHYHEQEREAHRQFQSRITSPDIRKNNRLNIQTSSMHQNGGNATRTSSSSIEPINNMTIAPSHTRENVNLSSPFMEERRTRRAVSMDETDVSPSISSREERANRRRSTSMDETVSPARKKQKTTTSKKGRSPGITPQKEIFTVGDSVFSCWWSNGPHVTQGYFSCKITKVYRDGKKYDIVYDDDGKKGQRVPRSFVKRAKPV